MKTYFSLVVTLDVVTGTGKDFKIKSEIDLRYLEWDCEAFDVLLKGKRELER